MIRTFFILIFCLPMFAFALELKPFVTDGCSSFPEGTLKQRTLWHNCCVQHDIRYWQGGTYEERAIADKELHMCVSKVGEPEIARLMLAGVRVGGSPYWPTPYRWGYGWPYFRDYGVLSEAELLEVAREMSKFRGKDDMNNRPREVINPIYSSNH